MAIGGACSASTYDLEKDFVNLRFEERVISSSLSSDNFVPGEYFDMAGKKHAH